MKITKRQLRKIIKEAGENPNKPWDANFPPAKATAMGHTSKSDELFDARDNLLGLIELLEPAEFDAYINSLISELEMMKQDI